MNADIGIIGGSGFYSLLENPETIEIDTPYGKPSDSVSIGKIGGKTVAFIPRHGSKHTLPPHKVPYRANIEALNSLGVKRVIGSSACGSLRIEFKIGQMVFFDQMINMTSSREETFFDEGDVVHVSTADPYCPQLRANAGITAAGLGIDHRDAGCVIVINGPRFSTKAESRLFRTHGADLINMTQYPEVALARERAMCYLGIGLVTDYDSGAFTEGIAPVAYDDVKSMFAKNTEKLKTLISNMITDLTNDRICSCKNSLDGAKVTV